jgi:hypothetical protein
LHSNSSTSNNPPDDPHHPGTFGIHTAGSTPAGIPITSSSDLGAAASAATIAITTTTTTSSSLEEEDASFYADEWEEWRAEADGESRRAKVRVDLGTWVYPRVPFPYFFELGAGLVAGKEREEERARVVREEEERVLEEKEKERKEREEKEKEKEKEQEQEEKKQEVVADTKMEEGEIEEDVSVKKESTVVENKLEEVTTTSPNEKVKINNTPPLPAPPAAAATMQDLPSPEPPQQPLLDLETRTTILIPSGYIPTEKPLRLRLWGGGDLTRAHDLRFPCVRGRKEVRGARVRMASGSAHRWLRGIATSLLLTMPILIPPPLPPPPTAKPAAKPTPTPTPAPQQHHHRQTTPNTRRPLSSSTPRLHRRL